MTYDSLEDAFSDFNEDHSIDRQSRALHYVVENIGENIPLLIMPSTGKKYWQCSANALMLLGSPKIDKYLSRLLVWLQDLNWPGAGTIFQALLAADKAALAGPLAESIGRAKLEGDEDWLEALDALKKALNAKGET